MVYLLDGLISDQFICLVRVEYSMQAEIWSIFSWSSFSGQFLKLEFTIKMGKLWPQKYKQYQKN